jgi:hypothetical protein
MEYGSGEIKNAYNILVRKPEGKPSWETLACMRIILKWI